MVDQIVSELRELDDLLRGRKTDMRSLEKGVGHLNALLFLKASIILGIGYGMCMGLFAVVNLGVPGLTQLAATMIKVPMLFLLTIAVTYPSLYVFSAMLGAKFGPADLFRILITSVAVNLAVLASLGPITGFFTITTTSYPFMKILNVLFFFIAGAIGVEFLRKTLFMVEFGSKDEPPESKPNEPPKMYGLPSANPPVPRRRSTDASVREVFYIWACLYVFVTIQMSWVLRPLIGDPSKPFVWFGERGGSAVYDFLLTFGKLLG